VLGGRYDLRSTLTFTPKDSGTPTAPILWRAAPGEEVIISGGKSITTHWLTEDGKIYFTDIPEVRSGRWDFDQLFVDGRRAVKARYPNLLETDPEGKSWLYVGSQTQDRILAGLARRGDFVQYRFAVNVSNKYDLWIGIACPAAGIADRLALWIDGKGVPLTFIAASRSFRTLRYTRLGPIQLASGQHSLRIENISSTEFRVHLGRVIFTDNRTMVTFGDAPPQPRADEYRVEIRPEDESLRSASFSSIGFQFFLPENAPDRFTIHTDPSRIKTSWALDPEARINLIAGLEYFNEVLHIDSIDRKQGIIRVKGKEAQELIRNGNRFFVSGVRDELDTPGEWYLDSHRGRLYYWPLPGKDPNRSVFIAPRLNRLIELDGNLDSSERVRWLQFRGFTFEYAGAGFGYAALRTATDAAIRLNGAWNCSIENCHFRNIDGFGIWLHLDSCENRIASNTIEHMGGGGILLTSARAAYGETLDPRPSVAGYAPLRNILVRNHIHHGGEVRVCSAGFLLDSRPLSTAMEPGNLIAFNHVHDMTRQGVFGFANQGGNIVAYNDFHDLVTESADAGAINFALMNNVTAPLLIRNNIVRRVSGLLKSGRQLPDYFGGVGIYLDWGTSHSTVINNFVESTTYASLLMNGGSWNDIENNIFLNNARALIFVPDGEAIGEGHRIIHNIIANTTGHSVPLWRLPSQMDERLREPWIPFVFSDENLFWNSGQPVELLPIGSLAQWQADGFDRHSMIADPQLTGSGNLQPSSPAIHLGFHPINTYNAGIAAESEMRLDVRQLAVCHEEIRLPSEMRPRTPLVKVLPYFCRRARYMVYLRYLGKDPNQTLTAEIFHEGGISYTRLKDHLSLGRVPDLRWGIDLGVYEFAPGKHEGLVLDWRSGAPGSLPAEVIFLEHQ